MLLFAGNMSCVELQQVLLYNVLQWFGGKMFLEFGQAFSAIFSCEDIGL